MNRPGQPPQRPPNLGPGQGLGGPFRGPYPTGAYGMPPRSALQQQGFPGMPNSHRTPGQGMVLPTANFMQQRGQNSYPFGASMQHQQPQQHSQSHPTSTTSLGHAQQQAVSGTVSSSLPPHLQSGGAGGANAPSMGNAQSSSSTNDVALDPNDFPALGSGSANTGNSSAVGVTSSPVTTLASSYASQAGTSIAPSGSATGQGSASGTTNSNQQRDFTPDDFPALGGQSTSQQSSSQAGQGLQSNQDSAHPPGLNGFEHRQNMPGVLNLGSQRNLVPSLQQQSDTEKRATSKLATWNGSSQNSSSQFPTQQNGTLSHGQQLNAPPGVPPPFQQQSMNNNHQTLSAQPYSAIDGTLSSTTQPNASATPQTPAQQILMSAADRWGLLGLLNTVKNQDPDQNLLSVGTDLGTMGLDMQTQGTLFSTFITPWSDSSAAHTVEPDFHLPACYNVQPPQPGPSKAQAFSEETLFYMFYGHPRDILQEVAAQELFSRNWRFNKELRLWLTKESGHVRQSKPIDGGEQGTFTYWDPDLWEKHRKDFTVLYADLEDKQTPAFSGSSLQSSAQSTGQQQAASVQGQVQSAGVVQLSQQNQTTGRPTFQGLGMSAASL